MSVIAGSNASSSTERRPQPDEAQAAPRAGGTYLAALAHRREAAAIRRQIGYGLVVGWVLTLVGGFFFYCVATRAAWVWGSLALVGAAHLGLAVVLPQALDWPERIWSAIAQWQGKLLMSLLLTAIYFGLFWPASRLRRRGDPDFCSWQDRPPDSSSAWRPLDEAEADTTESGGGQRGLPLLLAGVIAFFIRRRQFILLPILILLLIVGLALFFVQSSVLAPFIYTLF